MNVKEVLAGRKMAALREDFRGATKSIVDGNQRVHRAAVSAFMSEGLCQLPGMIRPIANFLLHVADLAEELNSAEDLDQEIEALATELFPDYPEYD